MISNLNHLVRLEAPVVAVQCVQNEVVRLHTIPYRNGRKSSSGEAWQCKFILKCPVVLSINRTLHTIFDDILLLRPKVEVTEFI